VTIGSLLTTWFQYGPKTLAVLCEALELGYLGGFYLLLYMPSATGSAMPHDSISYSLCSSKVFLGFMRVMVGLLLRYVTASDAGHVKMSSVLDGFFWYYLQLRA
jgi:hypothetical protein